MVVIGAENRWFYKHYGTYPYHRYQEGLPYFSYLKRSGCSLGFDLLEIL